MVGNICIAIVATRMLSTIDYATLRQAFLIFDVVSPILFLGLPQAIYYFLPKRKKSNGQTILDHIFLMSLAIVLFGIFLFGSGADILGSTFSNPDLGRLLPWLLPYFFGIGTISILSAASVSLDRVAQFTGFIALSGAVTVIISIVALYVYQDPQIVIAVRSIVSFAMIPVASYVIYPAISGSLARPEYPNLNEILKYAVPLGLASAMGILTMQTHSFIVASMFSPEEFAIFVNGAMEVPFIGIIVGSITSVALSEMSKACSENEKNKALEIFRECSLKGAILIFPVMVLFSFCAEQLIVLMYSETYAGSALFFQLYLLVLPIRIVVFGSAMMALGMTREIMFRSAIDFALNAVLCYWFVIMFGLVGAALSLAVTLYVWTVPYNVFKLARGFDIRVINIFPVKNLLQILAISCCGAPFLWWATKNAFFDNLLTDFIIMVLTYTAVTAFLLEITNKISLRTTLKKGVIHIRRQVQL